MEVRAGGKEVEGDGSVYAVGVDREVDRQPLVDLRTRLVLWFLCLLFLGIVYWGMHQPLP